MSDRSFPKQMKMRGNKEITAGYENCLAWVIDFLKWAESKGAKLTAEDIRGYCGCSRATSYRYLNAYRNAAGRRAA